MGAKADNHTGFGHKKQYTASSDRGTQRNSDNAKLRYVNSLVIVFVIIFVTVILSDLRYINNHWLYDQKLTWNSEI